MNTGHEQEVFSASGIGSLAKLDEPYQQEPIRVFLRLRPFSKVEQTRRSTNCMATRAVESDADKVSYASIVGRKGMDRGEKKTINVDTPLEGEFNFVFDEVFGEDSTQSALYEHIVAPLASHALEGFNCALIAYGQTGSGKTYTMMGNGAIEKKTPSKRSIGGNSDEQLGLIHLLIKDVFRLINNSPPTTEYIVRCSFVEIYLEKVLDLLNPTNRTIQILSGRQGTLESAEGSKSRGVSLHGASEACCFDESDVISLLTRGNACRTVSSTKMNTDSSRSHAVFIMKIEQKDSITGFSKGSHLQMIDMAGSELSGKVVVDTKRSAIHQEATMINKSIALLHTVVKKVVENQLAIKDNVVVGEFNNELYKQSKLTHLLREAFGGNCRTSLILTASPASYNISETIRTMKFGQLCHSVKNHVKPSVEISPFEYRRLLNDLEMKRNALSNLVNELSAECFQLKQDAKKENFVESQYDGPLWKIIETILVNGASPASISGAVSWGSKDSANEASLKDDVGLTRGELEKSRYLCEKLENLLAERQTEVAVLRTQNDIYTSEKKKDLQELVIMKNEIRFLTQRKQEVEHNLRTSQFREYEATVFLRQFRRFYRRLLRNKAHQGTGRTSDVIERVPGVPDLNDLIDVDSLLLEAGLIEESELHDDTATGAYRPSTQALGRSTDATNKSWKEAALHGKVDELESFDRSSLGGQREKSDHVEAGACAVAATSPHGQSISNRQQFLGTPAGRLTTMRERELERDLLRATERCIELQVALNEEKANVDVLTNRAGNINKKKFAQESIQLKQQLDKKTHDLQAIIWKMNELHLINKTYNEKMSNREQHVTYLEENLVELQSSNRNMIIERQEAEGNLREELGNLKVLVDAMTVPLWQFGECSVTGRTLDSRIRLPVRGCDVNENEETNAESLESLEESIVSYDDDDECEYEHLRAVNDNLQLRNASTQTAIAFGEKGTMTDTTLAGAAPFSKLEVSPFLSPSETSGVVIANSTQQETLGQHFALTKSDADDFISSRKSHICKSYDSFAREHFFRGGVPAGGHPRRFVNKFGLMIRPGVLTESRSKIS